VAEDMMAPLVGHPEGGNLLCIIACHGDVEYDYSIGQCLAHGVLLDWKNRIDSPRILREFKPDALHSCVYFDRIGQSVKGITPL
jgi:hypothetical protein